MLASSVTRRADKFSPHPVSSCPSSPASARSHAWLSSHRAKPKQFLELFPRRRRKQCGQVWPHWHGACLGKLSPPTPPASGKGRGVLQFTGGVGRLPCLKFCRKAKSVHHLEPSHRAVSVLAAERKRHPSSVHTCLYGMVIAGSKMDRVLNSRAPGRTVLVWWPVSGWGDTSHLSHCSQPFHFPLLYNIQMYLFIRWIICSEPTMPQSSGRSTY